MITNKMFKKILELEGVGINEASVMAGKSAHYFAVQKYNHSKNGKDFAFSEKVSARIVQTFPDSSKSFLSKELYNYLLNKDLNFKTFSKYTPKKKRKKYSKDKSIAQISIRKTLETKTQLKKILSKNVKDNTDLDKLVFELFEVINKKNSNLEFSIPKDALS